MTWKVLVWWAAMAMIAALPLEAQDEFADPGLWITGGGGFALGNPDCARCSAASKPSYSFLLAVGGSASAKVRYGIEGVAFIESSADTAREYFGATAVAQLFLIDGAPLHVQGGIGGGRYAEDGAGDLLEASGFNISLGTGYDWRFSRNFWARLYLRYLFSRGLTQKLNRQVQFTDLDFSLLQIGVGLTWQKL